MAMEPVFHELAREAFPRSASLEMQPEHPFTGYRADFYVLAGGDVELGWKIFSQPEILQSLNDARAQNAVFHRGVSAGAMHLSGAVMPLCETTKLGEENVHALPELQRYLNWVNLAVAVHEESQNWPTLEMGEETCVIKQHLPSFRWEALLLSLATVFGRQAILCSGIPPTVNIDVPALPERRVNMVEARRE